MTTPWERYEPADGSEGSGGLSGAPYGRQPSGHQPYLDPPYGTPGYGTAGYDTAGYGGYPQEASGAWQAAQPYGMPSYGGAGYAVTPFDGTGMMMPVHVQLPRKEPALSLLASFFLPGLGSMINGEAGKGIGILFLWLVGILLSVVLIGLPIAFGAWVWGMVDGYTGAQKHNARHGHL